MIVDDVEIFRRDLKRLKIWNDNSVFQIVQEAADGIEALKKLEENSIDVVITDIKMPRMDGIELLSKIAEQKLCPVVVLLSDYTEYNFARQGILYGAFDYIGKPVEEKGLTELLGRIEKHLSEKQQEEQNLLELQEIVEEVFFTASDVKQMMELMYRGEGKAIELLTEMVDTIGETMQNDKSKAVLIVKNTLQEIVSETLNYYNWITLYIDTNTLYKRNLANCKEWSEIKEATLVTIENLLRVINQFLLCQNNALIKRTCEYILENIDHKISVTILSKQMFISKAHLSEMFKQKVGLTLLEYITMVKMERAKRLLADENNKVYEIAYRLGYQDTEYFNKLFKKHEGKSLTEYRQK